MEKELSGRSNEEAATVGEEGSEKEKLVEKELRGRFNQEAEVGEE